MSIINCKILPDFIDVYKMRGKKMYITELKLCDRENIL